MPLYLTRFSYTSATWAKLIKNPEDRRTAAKKYVKAVGGKMHGFWYAFGDHDAYALYEAPDNVSMAAMAMVITSAERRTRLLHSQSGLISSRSPRRWRWRRVGAGPDECGNPAEAGPTQKQVGDKDCHPVMVPSEACDHRRDEIEEEADSDQFHLVVISRLATLALLASAAVGFIQLMVSPAGAGASDGAVRNCMPHRLRSLICSSAIISPRTLASSAAR